MADQDETVPPASVEQGATPQSAPTATEQPTFDTQAVLDKVKDVFEPDGKTPEDPPPEKVATPPKADSAESPAPVGLTPESTPEKADPEPKVVDDDDDDEDVLVSDPKDFDRNDPRLKRWGKRMDKARERLAAFQKDAAFGSTLVNMAKEGNMSPEMLAWWNALGVRANMGDPQAIQEMAGVLQNLGWKPPQPAPAQVDTGIDAVAERIYKEVFSDDVKALNIDEDLAKSKARKLAEREMAGRTPQTPPPPPAQYQPPVQTPQPQPQRQADPLASAVAQSLHERQQRFAASIPNFDKVNAEVVKRIQALGPNNVPLIDRPAHYEQMVIQVQREMAATKRTPPQSTGLRSSTMAAPNKTSVKEKILNDPEIWGQ